MKISTVKGTNDYLPREAALRDFLQNTILEVYQANGFERIMTPVIEDAENLDKSDGGDNLNLLFKIIKRGEKLNKALENQDYNGLTDMGLRYDLTLPLSRYFANNRSKLLMPFKCIQIDKVYRAERPQKGRLRELVQCDIDILGSDSMYCEIELIDVTAKALIAIGISDFKVRINDRNVLKTLLLQFGFFESEIDSVCISLDKLAKIGITGIEKELYVKECSKVAIERLVQFISGELPSITDIRSQISGNSNLDNLDAIIDSVKQVANGKYEIVFDISLVRGQGYYTGIVFEIESNEFKDSIAGGGRYDNLIGKFINEKVPAVGFSIGFERIFCILSDRNYFIPNAKKRVAFIYDEFFSAYELAKEYRTNYDTALFEKPKKLGRFLNKLQADGYYGYVLPDKNSDLIVF